jgi:hypothetical protein
MDNNGFFANGFISDGVNLADISDTTGILSENRKYSETYPELMRQEANQLDARNQYRRTVMQTVNILVATAVLLGFIYNQK